MIKAEIENCEQTEKQKHDEKVKELCSNCNKPMWRYTYVNGSYLYCSFCHLRKDFERRHMEQIMLNDARKRVRYVLYQCDSRRMGMCFLNFKDAFDVGLRKFGKDNFYIELQADYWKETWCGHTNIKTISKVTDFDKMKELATDADFNQSPDIYKANTHYAKFIKELIMQ